MIHSIKLLSNLDELESSVARVRKVCVDRCHTGQDSEYKRVIQASRPKRQHILFTFSQLDHLQGTWIRESREPSSLNGGAPHDGERSSHLCSLDVCQQRKELCVCELRCLRACKTNILPCVRAFVEYKTTEGCAGGSEKNFRRHVSKRDNMLQNFFWNQSEHTFIVSGRYYSIRRARTRRIGGCNVRHCRKWNGRRRPRKRHRIASEILWSKHVLLLNVIFSLLLSIAYCTSYPAHSLPIKSIFTKSYSNQHICLRLTDDRRKRSHMYHSTVYCTVHWTEAVAMYSQIDKPKCHSLITISLHHRHTFWYSCFPCALQCHGQGQRGYCHREVSFSNGQS